MTEAMSVAFLLKSLAYGIPGSILLIGFLVFLAIMKYQKTRSVAERKEHMKKWGDMIDTQKQVTASLIESHRGEMTRLIDNHRDELDRMLRVNERQAAAMESMAHNLTILSQAIEAKTICPYKIEG